MPRLRTGVRPRPMRWVGLTLWVVATTLGWILVSAGGLAAAMFPGVERGPQALLVVLQWLVLRFWVPKVGWWVPASVVGWYAAPYVGQGLVYGIRLVLSREGIVSMGEIMLMFALYGAAIGAMQYLVLRRTLARARWWIAAVAVPWGLGELTAEHVAELLPPLGGLEEPVASYVEFWGTNALLHAVVTGVALAWITRRPDVRARAGEPPDSR